MKGVICVYENQPVEHPIRVVELPIL
jgi:hypothetical protein